MAAKKSAGGKSKAKKDEKRTETKDEAISGNVELSKNPIRTLMFRDIMLDEIVDGLKAEQVPKEDMDEVLFLTAANAVLDKIGTNLPEDLLCMFQENLDDYLAISMINREHKVDLLSSFRDSFLESQGDSFSDERDLMEALTAFEDQWWESPKDFLGDVSPNQLIDQAKEKMASVLQEGEECECEECGDDDYWAARAYIIRDLWFPSMAEAISKEGALPSPQKRERLFAAVTNAMLDMLVNVMPDFMTEDLFQGLDHSLEMALVNKENKVDVLHLFEAALVKFEAEWWCTAMKELGNKSPDQALQEMGKKYGL